MQHSGTIYNDIPSCSHREKETVGLHNYQHLKISSPLDTRSTFMLQLGELLKIFNTRKPPEWLSWDWTMTYTKHWENIHFHSMSQSGLTQKTLVFFLVWAASHIDCNTTSVPNFGIHYLTGPLAGRSLQTLLWTKISESIIVRLN